jgi:serine/threonine-protein kinase HipA
MIERTLEVFLEQTLLGVLAEGNGIWRFTYDPAWVGSEGSFPIAPGLPLQQEGILDEGTKRPVQWFFDNLLPEEQLRTRLAQERNIDQADAFALLLAYGAESAGALTLLPPGAQMSPPGRRLLTDDALAKRLKDLPKVTLEAKAPKKMSLAGAQNKLPLILAGDDYFEPEGSEASTHILKPNHPDTATYPESVVNEWAVMQMAARIKLRVPTTMHRYCPKGESPTANVPIFLIERFDRVREGNHVRRLHAIDACQLLNIDRTYKTQAMTLETLTRIATNTRSRGTTRLRLYEWSIFNVLVGNRDAHLKNLSFLVNATGIELSPHYDLLSTALFDAGQDGGRSWIDNPMSLEIQGAQTYAQVTRDKLVALGQALGIKRPTAERILDGMVRNLPKVFDEILKMFETAPHPESAKLTRAAESRVLRQIRHVVIEEMLRLAAKRETAVIAKAKP